MSGETWKLLEWFKSNDTDMKFAINSNLGAKDELIDRLIEATHSIKHFHLYTSNESMNLQAEYIRDGLVFDDWANNVERLLDSGKFRGLLSMCTINALCLDSLDSYLEMIYNWKLEYGKDSINFSLNILRFPSFQSPLVLPDSLRTKYKNRLTDWYNCYKTSPLVHQMEVNQVARLIDYLDVVKTPHAGAAEQTVLQQDFKQFYTQYDQRRNKDFWQTFPNLVEWYDSIQI